jgi:hypothetical protein
MQLQRKSLFDRYYLVWIILIHAFYFAAALIIHSIYTLDSYEYVWQAANLKASASNYCGDPSLPIQMDLYTRRTVLYGFLLMLTKLVYSSNFTILVLQNIISIANIYYFPKLLKSYSFGFNTRPVILVAFLLFPTWCIYTNMVMSELMLGTCVVWAFYHFTQFLQSGKPKHIFFYNLLITLAVLVKPVFMYFWIVNILLMAYLFYRNRHWAILAFSLLMPAAIFIHSWANERTTGYFHYCSIKNLNFLHYNSQILLAHAGGLDWSWKQVDSIQAVAETKPDFKSYNEFIVAECTRIHKENFPVFLKIQAGGMLNFFIDPGRYDMEQFFPPKKVVPISFFHQLREKGIPGIIEYAQRVPIFKVLAMLLIMVWNVFIMLSLVFFAFNRRVPWLVRLILILIVGYVCALTGPMGDSRFKMPVYPLLVFTIPFFLDRLLEWRRNRKARTITGE